MLEWLIKKYFDLMKSVCFCIFLTLFVQSVGCIFESNFADQSLF